MGHGEVGGVVAELVAMDIRSECFPTSFRLSDEPYSFATSSSVTDARHKIRLNMLFSCRPYQCQFNDVAG